MVTSRVAWANSEVEEELKPFVFSFVGRFPYQSFSYPVTRLGRTNKDCVLRDRPWILFGIQES